MSMAARVRSMQEMKRLCIPVVCISVTIFVAACQKNSSPDTAAASVEASNSASGVVSSAPTGLVKSTVRHTEETANVTRWWDIAEKKTAIQTAREEKMAKETKELKLAQETKLAQEAKTLAAK